MLLFWILNIAAGIAVLVIGVLLLIVLAVIALVIFGLPYILFVAIMKSFSAFLIFSIILGIPFILFSIFVFIAVRLPFSVFFRLLSIKYLVSLNCGYSEELLVKYSAKKVEPAKIAHIFAAISVLILAAVFLIGIISAIAIPNFIKARQNALNQQKAAVQMKNK